MLIAPPEVRLPSEASLVRAKRELVAALGPSKVIDDVAGCERFARDESEAVGRVPDVVVVAERAEDIDRGAHRRRSLRRADHSPRGGTGRTGGAVPVAGGILLATHALAQVKEIDRRNRIAVVQPGVVTGELHALVEKEGLFYPRIRTRSRRA